MAEEPELARAADRLREAGIYCDARRLRHRPEWEGIAAPLDVDALR